MQRFLGVQNASDDFSMGYDLTAKTSRNWHFAGNNMNFAFIIDKDMILEKLQGGTMTVTDYELNPLENYQLDIKLFRNAMNRLNKFYK